MIDFEEEVSLLFTSPVISLVPSPASEESYDRAGLLTASLAQLVHDELIYVRPFSSDEEEEYEARGAFARLKFPSGRTYRIRHMTCHSVRERNVVETQVADLPDGHYHRPGYLSQELPCVKDAVEMCRILEKVGILADIFSEAQEEIGVGPLEVRWYTHPIRLHIKEPVTGSWVLIGAEHDEVRFRKLIERELARFLKCGC
jgi:hypothetical protein